jgi:hypothetical protein
VRQLPHLHRHRSEKGLDMLIDYRDGLPFDFRGGLPFDFRGGRP